MTALRTIIAVMLAALALPALSDDAPTEDNLLLPGIYECVADGQYFFLRLGSELDYQQTDPSDDPGSYERDSATGIIRFTTGPYAIGQWTADVHNAADQHGIILHAEQDYDCKAAR